ncbi:hypothetical protein DB891_11655 [Flavobacterium laiguense]|uniref:Uncharacterized protein n=1 Tax=Flavobacterium laiguense TaxID=2169409 RepID=A0A2U1JTD9_9FLAO|nr:hypothetical protein DB891_11655 [Flavobacterium laiguense]
MKAQIRNLEIGIKEKVYGVMNGGKRGDGLGGSELFALVNVFPFCASLRGTKQSHLLYPFQ